MNKTNLLLFAVACLVLCACHGVSTGPIVAGIAGVAVGAASVIAGGLNLYRNFTRNKALVARQPAG